MAFKFAGLTPDETRGVFAILLERSNVPEIFKAKAQDFVVNATDETITSIKDGLDEILEMAKQKNVPGLSKILNKKFNVPNAISLMVSIKIVQEASSIDFEKLDSEKAQDFEIVENENTI